MADICLALQRDTVAENHQSFEQQVCSQHVFESEANLVV